MRAGPVLKNIAAGAAFSFSACFSGQAVSGPDPATDKKDPFPATAPFWTIPFKGAFNDASVNKIAGQITSLRKKDPSKKIRMEFFDITGGEIEAGFNLAGAMYEAGNIDVVCRGNLQSMGATVFVSYQGGERIAASDCKNFMMHDLIVSLWNPTPGIKLVRSYAAKLSDNLQQALRIMTTGTAQAAKISPEAAGALFGEDCNLSPYNAYRLGLFDRFEKASAITPERLSNPSAQDVYTICGTTPLAESINMTDWTSKNFGIRQTSPPKSLTAFK